MPVRSHRGWVVVCPVCGERPDMGCDYRPIFDERKSAVAAVEECSEGEALDEKAAYCCSSICGDLYSHRYCPVRPCGYCASKSGDWPDALMQAARELRDENKEGYWFILLWWMDVCYPHARKR